MTEVINAIQDLHWVEAVKILGGVTLPGFAVGKDKTQWQDTPFRTLRLHHGIGGYGVFLVVISQICRQKGLCLTVDNSDYLTLLADDCQVAEKTLTEIIQTLCRVELLDLEAWQDRALFSKWLVANNQSAIWGRKRNAIAHQYTKHRNTVYQRDDHSCVYCGCTDRLSLDHLFPLSRGGSNNLPNLVTACLPCNISKGDRTPEEWRN